MPLLAKEPGGRKFPTPLPSQKLLFTLLGQWCLPCQRCRMSTKLLPEDAECDAMFLSEATGGGQKFCQRLAASLLLIILRYSSGLI